MLDALQELTRLAVMTETGDRSRLMLDVAGYRDRRRKELTALASDAVAEVKQTGDRVALAPMNPFERKIVHDAVAAAGLTSESEGEEPRRHVLVLPRTPESRPPSAVFVTCSPRSTSIGEMARPKATTRRPTGVRSQSARALACARQTLAY